MKRILSLTLAVIMTATTLFAVPFCVKAETATSGKCGDNLTWTIDTDNGLLEISGTGDMYDYNNGYESPFYENKNKITNIKINNGVTSIGKYAFSNSWTIKSISIPATLTAIKYKAIEACYSLENIIVDPNNKSFVSENNTIFNADKTELIWYPKHCENTYYEIPSTVRTICTDAFSNSQYLKSVTIPDSVEEIGESAFACCHIENINLPNSIKKIGDLAFYGCNEIESISIPYGVTEIPYDTFYSCENLKSITIPSSVKTIGYGAFQKTSLKTVNYCGTSEDWEKIKINTNCNEALLTASINYHKFSDDYTIIKEATCSEGGIISFKCLTCGGMRTEEIAANGQHTFVVISKVEPTCISQGFVEYECSSCGYSYTKILYDVIHNYDIVVTKEPTCTESGAKTHTCRYCGDSYTEIISVKGHNYNIVVTKEPTCTEEGVKTFTCTTCGYSYTRAIEKSSHNYNIVLTKKPSCIEEGILEYTCVNCGDTYTEPIEKLPHKYDTGIVTTAPTCAKEGIKTFTCSYCGDTYTEAIAATNEHTYKNTVTKATLTNNGKIVPKCSCGATKAATTIYYPKAITLAATTYTYDGKVKAPKVTVKGADGKVIAASNYTVSYASGRKAVGKYAVKITFKGNYSGTKTLYFTIKPAKPTITSISSASNHTIKLKWKKVGGSVTGFQVCWAKDKSFKNVISTKTAKGASLTTYTGKNFTKGKRYYVRVRAYKTVKVNGKNTNIYSAWSAGKSIVCK